MNANEDINKYAEALEQKTLELIQSEDWLALDAMIASECQFVTNSGVYTKTQSLDLMKKMRLTSASIRNVKATACGDSLIVSFELSCSELINGEQQSTDYSPRLSVWKQIDGVHRCIAYGDFNTSKRV